MCGGDVRAGIKKQREREGKIQLPFPPTHRSTPSMLFLRPHPFFFFFEIASLLLLFFYLKKYIIFMFQPLLNSSSPGKYYIDFFSSVFLMILMHRCKKNILIKKYILKIHLITKHTIITGSRLIELNNLKVNMEDGCVIEGFSCMWHNNSAFNYYLKKGI